MRAKLHTPAHPPTLTNVLLRVAVVAFILLAIVLVLYFEGGLIDSKTSLPPGFLDCLYFTMVTVTTVGYGDIVPDSTFSRMVDTFFLTPLRFFVFVLFVGIAYQLSLKQLREDYRMNRIVSKLHNHIILCGYGETGHAAADELILQGEKPGQIVVVDTDPAKLDDAASLGLVAVKGDATREDILKSVAIQRAAHILICPGRDDSAVLIALTAGDLNPGAPRTVMCHEQENVRLMERSGADTIISPSAAGGNLMAAATRQPHLVDTLIDIMSVGGTLRVDEREVLLEEVGTHPRELSGMAPVRVYRGDKWFNINNLPKLEEHDILVFVTADRVLSPTAVNQS